MAMVPQELSLITFQQVRDRVGVGVCQLQALDVYLNGS